MYFQGYHGDQCDQVCDSCDASPCYNEGFCQRNGEGYTCACKSSRYLLTTYFFNKIRKKI